MYAGAQSGNFFFKKYTTRDGLSDHYVLSISQDSRGFLWASTYNGLNRFDGKNFISFGFQEGLTNKQIGRVVEDRDHRLWIATTGNVFEFKNNRFFSYPFSDSISNTSYINNLLQLDNGQVLVQTNRGTYFFSDDHWEKTVLLPGYEGRACPQIIETGNGTYYNFSDAIVKKATDNTITELWAVKHAGLTYFNNLVWLEDTLYVACRDGLFQLTDDKKRKEIFKGKIPGNGWINFMIDTEKKCWVSRVGILKLYMSAPGDKDLFSDSIPLTIPLISGFFEDRNKNIWVAAAEGLLKIQRQHASHFTIAGNPLIRDIRNIAETPGGAVYFFSRENGILEFNGTDFIRAPIQFPVKMNPGNDFPDSYFTDAKKRMWFATRRRRLFRLEEEYLTDCSYLLPDIGDLFWIGLNPRNQRIYISVDTLKTGNDSATWLFVPRNMKKIIRNPRNMLGLTNGKMLINTAENGVLMIDEKDIGYYINEQLGLGNASPAAFFTEDKQGGFWMYGSSFGLKHFTWNDNGLPKNDMTITKSDGLPADIISSVCIDSNERIWALTTKSLVVIQAGKKNSRIEINQLDELMNSNIEVPENARLYATSGGEIWLTDKNQIYKFDPGKIEFVSRKPGITFEEIQINFQKTTWGKYADSLTGYWQFPVNPVLNHNENNLSISFSGISFTAATGLFYSYNLGGLDTTWSRPAGDNRIILTNLKPGKYRFRVKAKTINSDWSEPAVFSFIIRPPFWNTLWFRLLVFSIAAGLIVSVYRRRVKKIQQEAFIKNQLNELEMTALKAQMNPHFIYNALNSIQSLVASDKKDEAVHYIGTFSRLLRQVLEQSDNNVIPIEKELQTLEHYISLESLRLNMHPDYLVELAGNIQPDTEKIPPLILQPFVENALWHGLGKKEGEKIIRINMSADESWLTCTITDNGIGREKASASGSENKVFHKPMAIEITRKRLVDFNNDSNIPAIQIEDLFTNAGTPAGTKVTLQIKRKS